MPRGLVLVTNPTGSGKSTTLAAMIDYLNHQHSTCILTIEDPIEFVHGSRKCLINQREVHKDTRGFGVGPCVRIRTSSWWAKCGTWRPSGWRSRRRRPGTWCLRPCIPAPPSRPSSASSMSSPRERRTWRVPCSRNPCARDFTNPAQEIVGGRIAVHEIIIGTPTIRNLIREDRVAQLYSSIQTGQAFGM